MDTVVEDVRPQRPGVTPPSRPEGSSGFFDDVVVELGLVNKETADWAVEQGRVAGQAVPKVLLDARVLDEIQLSRATAELHGLDHVDLAEFEVDMDVAKLISKSAAQRYGAVPIAFDEDGTLLVALADPVDPLAVDDIAVMTKSDVHPMVAAPSSIDAVIEQLVDAPAPVPEPARIESVYGRPAEPEAQPQPAYARPEATTPAAAPAPAAPPAPPAPDPVVNEEMAQMRQALADLAARVETFTEPPAAAPPEPAPPEPAPPEPAAPAEPSVTVEEHDGVLDRLAEAERRASEANGALDRLGDAERRAQDAEAALKELRSERDRERLRHQQAEQSLTAQLETAKEATRRLEQRLSNVLAVTAEIRAACEKLVESPPR